jgi:hypothetical protein
LLKSNFEGLHPHIRNFFLSALLQSIRTYVRNIAETRTRMAHAHLCERGLALIKGYFGNFSLPLGKMPCAANHMRKSKRKRGTREIKVSDRGRRMTERKKTERTKPYRDKIFQGQNVSADIPVTHRLRGISPKKYLRTLLCTVPSQSVSAFWQQYILSPIHVLGGYVLSRCV